MQRFLYLLLAAAIIGGTAVSARAQDEIEEDLSLQIRRLEWA